MGDGSMPIHIVVKNRSTEEIVDEADDINGRLERRLARMNREQYAYLRYIDPYGDTIFNRLQMEEVIPEMERLFAGSADDGSNKFFEYLLNMAKCCRDGVDLYLEFVGD